MRLMLLLMLINMNVAIPKQQMPTQAEQLLRPLQRLGKLAETWA
ncbi:hypothetical protein [Alcanivorax jadensis]|nr:hypothetical protein [Alcanivorax jadensis]MDF1637217.1 hypothetical protein [Alcanivorax jadensis]